MLTQPDRDTNFPSLKSMVYFNSAAEGIPPLAVGNSLAQYFRDKALGMEGRDFHFKELEKLKIAAGSLLGFSPSEIGVCSCSSEAFNLAAMALRLKPADEVVINDLDFPAGATPWLQDNYQGTTRLWKSKAGILQIEDLLPLLNDNTSLVTLSLVSFFNGFKINLKETAAAIRKKTGSLIAVDVTQALGRISFDLSDADLVVSSTHKWILGPHGGGIVAIPEKNASRWVVPAGGWFHLHDAFGPDRFSKAQSKAGAASFSVGMPNFPAIYPIRTALEFILNIGVNSIEKVADPLVAQAYEGTLSLGLEMLLPPGSSHRAGIFAFRHQDAERIHGELKANKIHVMHHAGRLRVAIHGYNTEKDVESYLVVLHKALKK